MTDRRLGPPPPPTSLPLVPGGTFAVTPTEGVRWDDDLETWACRYTTDHPGMPEEFRTWQAVWDGVLGRWEVDEL